MYVDRLLVYYLPPCILSTGSGVRVETKLSESSVSANSFSMSSLKKSAATQWQPKRKAAEIDGTTAASSLAPPDRSSSPRSNETARHGQETAQGVPSRSGSARAPFKCPR